MALGANSLRARYCLSGRFFQRFCNAEGHAVLPFSRGVSEHGFLQPALDLVAKLLPRHPRIDIMVQLHETALVEWQGIFSNPSVCMGIGDVHQELGGSV